MLENIKSSYILQMIFLNIKEEKKLEIIKYNKYLQNKINVDIFNYKIFSGKYIVYETKEKGKIYDPYYGHLLFEGELLKGKRNGKGKEYYDDGGLKFEGEYIKGKRNGKGIEYNKEGDLIFEGEYLNGKRNGKGKEYLFDKLIFEGEYLNGEKVGQSKDYYNGGLLEFEGEDNYIKLKTLKIQYKYLNKERKGIENQNNENDNRIYEDEIANGKRNGKGKEYYDDGELKFEGEYLNGKRNGKGKEYFLGKLIFEGEYLYDHRKRGKLFINGRLEYEGEFLYDKKWSGKGYDEKGNIIYELINGKGKVEEFYLNGELLFEGEY